MLVYACRLLDSTVTAGARFSLPLDVLQVVTHLSYDNRTKILNGLQDHHQKAWWEGDNCRCGYLEMEEIQIPPSIPLSLKLHSRSGVRMIKRKVVHQPKGATRTLLKIAKQFGLQSPRIPFVTLHFNAFKSCSVRQVPSRSTDPS